MKEQYFGEWAEYRGEEEKEEARQYLLSWKKFFLRKISLSEFVEEVWVERENIPPVSLKGTMDGPLKSTLGLKIRVNTPDTAEDLRPIGVHPL